MAKHTLVAVILALATLLSPLRAIAQPADPAALVAAHEAGVNAGDLEAAAAPFADDATVSTPRGQFVGRDQIRSWIQGIIRLNTRFELVGDRQVTGDAVTWVRDGFADDARSLGYAPFRNEVRATIRDGKVQLLAVTATPETAAKAARARAALDLVNEGTNLFNSGNVDGALMLWADDAIATEPMGETFRGFAQLRPWLDTLVAQGAYIEAAGPPVVMGDRVIRPDRITLEPIRALGLDSIDVNHEYAVYSSKIRSLVVTLPAHSAALLQEAGNKVVARGAFNAFAAGNVDALLALVDASYVDHDPSPGQNPGIEGLRDFMMMFTTAFPGATASIDQIVADGDIVVVRATISGTHLGELAGIPPTGKTFTVTGTDIFRIVNGKIMERWGNFDDLGLLTQLGVIPSM